MYRSILTQVQSMITLSSLYVSRNLGSYPSYDCTYYDQIMGSYLGTLHMIIIIIYDRRL